MGITTVNNYLCKEGYYCPDGVSEVKCPAGTYWKLLGADDITDCLDCPPGYYCPTDATVNPIPCIGGTYCPVNSTAMLDCMQSFFCHEKSAVQTDCPEAYYCPTDNVDIYTKCDNNYYCPLNSIDQTITPCPDGMIGNSNPNNFDVPSSCENCPAGKYTNSSVLG